MLSTQIKSRLLRRLVRPESIIESRFFSDKPPKDGDKKQNFAKIFLNPAAEGQLNKKHSSGIPKLSARNKKPHLTPLSDNRGGRQKHIQLDEDLYPEDTARGESRSVRKGRRTPEETVDEDMREALTYFAPDLLNDDKYFWDEEDFDSFPEGDISEFLDEEGNFEIEYDAIDLKAESKDDEAPFEITKLIEEMDAMDDEEETVGELDDEDDEGIQTRNKPTRVDPEENFFFNQDDIIELSALGEDQFPATYKKTTTSEPQVLPLNETGPGLDDFLQSMIDHPTKFAEISRENLHPESKREPKPIFPTNRRNPPIEFVEQYPRFLYVSGLPPLSINGEPGNLNNASDNDMLKRTVAGLLEVDSTRVFCASTSSAFVGYDSPRNLADALAKGPTVPYLEVTPIITLYSGSEGPDFVKQSPGCVLLLEDIPAGHTSGSIARSLFPVGTEVGGLYGDIEPKDVHFLSRTSILIRMSSEEQAESAVHSSIVQARLVEFGQYPIRLSRARRELVHTGFAGPGRLHETRKVGPRLIVDGDMPSKKFYLSHTGVVCLWNIDKSMTAEDINEVFQPYSELTRYTTSVEIVKSGNAIDMGVVYVGFDQPGEAEAFMASHSGKFWIGDKLATAKLVKDRRIPGMKPVVPQQRLMRSSEELLDDLQNWEKHVDPKDIEDLEKSGISKEVLGDALVSIRYSNETFGPLDSPLESESLYADKDAGELYKELVQQYVKTLKECIATPDNVGPMYEAMHLPGEEINLDIFDDEKKRQEMLQKRRSGIV